MGGRAIYDVDVSGPVDVLVPMQSHYTFYSGEVRLFIFRALQCM